MDEMRYLAARDARATLLDEAVERARSLGAGTVAWITVNVPGPDKLPPGLTEVFANAVGAAKDRLTDITVALEGQDLLGPYAALVVSGVPAEVKRAAVALEEERGARRLIDIDVYDTEARPCDRARLGLPQRACLVCAEPARDCIRLQRHTPRELAGAVEALLAPLTSADALAASLVHGAGLELALTPKPGLVDRRDNGSHPDLSYDLMRESIALLPLYFNELLSVRRGGAALDACIDAGRRAEQRMYDAIGTNAHRGYIFLSGLLLLAACDVERDAPAGEGRPLASSAAAAGGTAAETVARMRSRVAALAREFFDRNVAGGIEVSRWAVRSAGRRDDDGIRAETMAGLPAVFDAGLPAFRNALRMTGHPTLAAFALLGVLMQRVQDTTALQRCGQDGLARLKRDGARLARLVASGSDPVPYLEALNDEYRRARLTMGGVADCMAVVFALHQRGAADAAPGAL